RLYIQLVLKFGPGCEDLGQYGGQQTVRHGQRSGNSQGTGTPFRDFARAGLELLQATQHIAYFFQKLPPLLGERDLRPCTREQGETELIFEVLQLPADDGLGSVKQPRGRCYAT